MGDINRFTESRRKGFTKELSLYIYPTKGASNWTTINAIPATIQLTNVTESISSCEIVFFTEIFEHFI